MNHAAMSARALGGAVGCLSMWTLSVCAGPAPMPSPAELLRPIAAPPSWAESAREPGIMRTRWAQADEHVIAALHGDDPMTVRLALFGNATFDCRLARRQSLPDGSTVRFGRLQEVDDSRVTLVLGTGVLAAAVDAGPRGFFDLRYAGDGLYLVRELDELQLATCGGSPQYTPRSVAMSTGVGFTCDDGSVLDLMVVYTTAARVAAGGTAAIAAQINMAVANANAAFTRSLINTQVNLVHTEEMSYAESGQWQIDGPRLVDPNDGYLDGVHPLRDQYGADCVCLLVSTLDVGGIGYFPDPSRQGIGASGFSMLRLDNAPFLTLAHELGHNLWCTHDRGHTTDIPFADYSYGYVEPGGAWEDIMAVAPTAGIPYFANPNLFWPGPNPPDPGPMGVPVGQPQPCDIALTCNQTRLIVANFRPTRISGFPPIVYVRSTVPSGGDGHSWTTAFRDLTDAVCAAAGSDATVQQIWVAAGTYKPDRGGGDRAATFRLVNGLTVYGGFAGGETNLSQRDPNAHPTILSGDIGASGDPNDNCYHVVTISQNDATAVLDGFTITGGNANGTAPDDGGGGVLAYGGGTATLVNCSITGNRALNFGGGLYASSGGSPTLQHCTISNNSVSGTTWPQGGGGVYCYTNCTPALSDCTLSGNSAHFGAGMANLFSCSPTLTRCVISANLGPSDGEGGGIYNYGTCNPVLDHCTLSGNTANFGGGLSSYFDSQPTLTNCVIRANAAASDGGGLYLYTNVSAALTNCLVDGNSAANGAGVACLFSSNAVLTNCTLIGNTATVSAGGFESYQSAPVLANDLLWFNTAGGNSGEPGQIGSFNSTPTLGYSSIQGWTGGLGGTANDGNYPLFVNAAGPDGVFGTPDDNPRLQQGSPSVNHGNNAAIPPGVVTDLDGRLRIVDGVVDRGAFEFALPGDFDGNGRVDFADFAQLTQCLTGPQTVPAAPPPVPGSPCLLAFDVNSDGAVDLQDFAGFAREFGTQQ